VADDIPARPEESPIRAAPVTVPVSPAAVAEILTEDGEITLPAGSGADDVTVAAARHLVDLVNGRVQPAGTPSFNSAAGTLTVPVPGSTVTISARNVTSRAPGGDPLACLTRAPIRRRSGLSPASPQPAREALGSRHQRPGASVRAGVPAAFTLSPRRPCRTPTRKAGQPRPGRPPRSPSPAARPMRKCYEL
jgi:hypothetical protein